MTRDCSTLMVAQYFKRKREFVEIFIVSGSGLGIVVMSTFIKSAIEAVGTSMHHSMCIQYVHSRHLLSLGFTLSSAKTGDSAFEESEEKN